VDFFVRVEDKGIGISEADKSNLFRPFFKTSDRKSNLFNKESNGLGLSICKEIANNLNGSLSFES
jgi:signal transduction histidine kinase